MVFSAFTFTGQVIAEHTQNDGRAWSCRVILELELELELDASADPSHPTDDNAEESYSLYISPFVSKMAI